MIIEQKAVLNTDAFRKSFFYSDPYHFWVMDETCSSPDIAKELCQSFPDSGYQLLERTQGKKKHRLQTRPLIKDNLVSSSAQFLDSIWLMLANQLLSGAYRQALEELCGTDLSETSLEASFYRQAKGGFIDPHPDNPDKVVTHLLYFAYQDWQSDYGGCLRILRSNDIEDFQHEILPRNNKSVVFLRSENSWHGYKPINVDSERYSLQIVFHKAGMKYSTE